MKDDLTILLVVMNILCLIWNVHMLLQGGPLVIIHLGVACLNSFAVDRLVNQ